MMESSAPVARLAPAGLDPRRWWALALLCGAFFMVLLDAKTIGDGLAFLTYKFVRDA